MAMSRPIGQTSRSTGWLAREWHTGRRLLDECIAAADWLEADPAHGRALIEAWNASLTLPVQDHHGRRCNAPSAL
jgi:hypothetical protein